VPGNDKYTLRLRSGDFYIINSHASGIRADIEHEVEVAPVTHGVIIVDFVFDSAEEEEAAMAAAAVHCQLMRSPDQAGGPARPIWPGMAHVVRKNKSVLREGNGPCSEKQLRSYDKLVAQGDITDAAGRTPQ
jgi:hypothetical protein